MASTPRLHRWIAHGVAAARAACAGASRAGARQIRDSWMTTAVAAGVAVSGAAVAYTASQPEAPPRSSPASRRDAEWQLPPVPNPRLWLRTAKDGDDSLLRAHLGVDGATTRAALGNMMLFSGRSNPQLADEISYELMNSLGRVAITDFADGEIGVHVLDNVRGKDVYIVHSTSQPVNEAIVELLLLISTMRRASARTITAVIPYYGYKRDVGAVASVAHQMRTELHEHELRSFVEFPSHAHAHLSATAPASHTPPPPDDADAHASAFPVSAADVALMLETVGVDRIISVELQPPGQGQIEGFFSTTIAVENVRSTSVAVEHISKLKLRDPVVVAPNESCIQLAHDIASGLSKRTGKAINIAAMIEAGPSRGMDRYMHKAAPRSEITNTAIELVGDVAGHDVVIVDDMIDTGRTLIRRLQVLKERGANNIVAFATHGLFNGSALQRITRSPLTQVVITNTVPLRDDVDTRHTHKIAQLSVAPILAEAILRMQTRQSLDQLSVYNRDTPTARYLGQE